MHRSSLYSIKEWRQSSTARTVPETLSDLLIFEEPRLKEKARGICRDSVVGLGGFEPPISWEPGMVAPKPRGLSRP